MAWTERKEIKTSYDDIVEYLEANSFHDFRIGYIDFNIDSLRICVEEVIDHTDSSNNAGRVWDFSFNYITSFEMKVDTVPILYIYDIKRGKLHNEIQFDLTNGGINIVSEQIVQGIPNDEELDSTKRRNK